MKLLGLSGSPSRNTNSRTLGAVNLVMEFAREQDSSLQAETLNIRDLDIEFCDGRDPSLYEGETKSLIEKIVGADALVLGTPVYRGSYTGILKTYLILFPIMR